VQVFERLIAWVFGLTFVTLAGLVTVETVMRRVFLRSLQGVDELGGYALAVGAALSFALALRSRAHIRIDVVHEHLPRFLRIVLNVIAPAAIAAAAAAVTVMAWQALADTIQYGSVAQTPWATPLKYPQFAWVLALAAFVLVAVVELMVLAGWLFAGRPDVIDHQYGPRGTREELADELADLEARSGHAVADASRSIAP